MDQGSDMANLNTRARQENTYDAIVVGSGISGGWAAKDLTEKGLKTLVLERGPMVRHIEDYPTATAAPWETKYPRSVSPAPSARLMAEETPPPMAPALSSPST